MALEQYCAACTYLGERADSNGKYWCERKGENHYATDPRCYSFCEAYSRSTSARENMYDNSKSHSSSGCYITTIMCHILGMPDDNYYLETLRNFRDNVLKKDAKHFPLLIQYDKIGPMIASCLENDESNKEIANVLFTNYIQKTVTAIEEGKINSAINIYVAMTQSLVEKYQPDADILCVDTDNIDMELLGHARTRKKVLETN